MKKLLLCMMCLMVLSIYVMSACTREDEVSGEYVDLGLPSGTKWKNVNESDGALNLYSFDQAFSDFGDKLPTKEQFEELTSSCVWTWIGDGYRVDGQNGKSITLPAAGSIGCFGGRNYEDSHGYYWSSDAGGYDHAWNLHIYQGDICLHSHCRCNSFSVRLVQK